MLKFIKSIFAPKHRITPLDLGSALFTTPSINDEIGLIGLADMPTDDCLFIHEDNWRSAEFVHDTHRQAIEQEINAIQDIHVDHQKSFGWDKVHVRRLIRNPLSPEAIPLQELLAVLPDCKLLSGVGYTGQQGIVDQGVALQTKGGLTIYCQISETAILQSICFEPYRVGQAENVSIEFRQLAMFAEKHSLFLVYWNMLVVCEPKKEQIQDFFEKNYHV